MLHIKTGFVCSESKSGQRVTKNSLFKFIGDIPASQMSSAFEDLGESGCILTFFGSCIHSLVHSFVHLIIHPFIHPFIRPCIHPSIHSFSIHSCIHSLNCVLINTSLPLGSGVYRETSTAAVM